MDESAYPDYANPELLDRMPLTARVVLDVGCARGALGAAYLRRNPRAKVLGIEADAAAASVARGRLHAVAEVNVEANPMPFEVAGGIDCITYGDVLEHLVDPWRVLKLHAEHLAQRGTMLVCMPNVEHWSFALRLLNGSFDYEDQGLFDRTHLRWFTPRMMGQALSAAGLELSDVAPRPVHTEQAQQFVQALAPGLRALGVDPAEYFNRAGPLQFVWRARKSPPARMVVRASALPPLGGVSEVRVQEPLRALHSESSVLTFVQEEESFPERKREVPHIAVLHRPLLLGEAGLARVKSLIAKGYVVVTEFDDHPSFMAERGVPVDEVLSFRAVHAVQTSTPALAEVLGVQNPEIAVFPNAILELPEVRNYQDIGRLTLFFGALNRGADWRDYLPVLNAFGEKLGERLRFSVVHDQALFEALESPHKQFTPTCDYPTYLRLLGEAEIAFMPLADTVFNRAKSDLKFLEAAAAGVTALASPTVYGGVVRHGENGMLFGDAAELRIALLRLVAFPGAAQKMALAARDYVMRERMLAYQLGAREAWYRGLWERRDALNAKLQARMPELFS